MTAYCHDCDERRPLVAGLCASCARYRRAHGHRDPCVSGRLALQYESPHPPVRRDRLYPWRLVAATHQITGELLSLAVRLSDYPADWRERERLVVEAYRLRRRLDEVGA